MITSTKKVLIKVVLEYDDGSKKFLDGEDLKNWEKANEACASLYWSHFKRTGYEKVKFKEEKCQHQTA